MADDKLEYPVTSPTTTIIFDGIIDKARGRQAMNSKDFGGSDGKSRQAASKRTQANTQVTFKFVTKPAKSVRTKVKELANLYKAQADKDMKLTINFADGGNVIYTGKIASEDGTFEGGAGAVRYIGTIDFNIATETWS